MALAANISRRSKRGRGCRCPKGTQKTFVGKFGIRCGRVRRLKGGGKRWQFVKTPKHCNH